MDLPRVGHAIIVNNVEAEFPGSVADVAALRTAFQAVGFDVHIYTNCSSQVCIYTVYFADDSLRCT